MIIIPEALYDTEEAAALIGLKRRTLEDWRYHQSGPAYIRLPKKILYQGSDLLAWLAEQKVKA